jgi:hypothetical protein
MPELSCGKPLLDDGRDMEGRKPRFRIVITEDEHATAGRMHRGVIPSRHEVFTIIARSNCERRKRSCTEELAESRNHISM